MARDLKKSIEETTAPLGTVIEKLRSELSVLLNDTKVNDLKFQVGEIEVELQVGITADANGEIGFDCWLYKAAANVGIERAATQTVKFKLTPVWKGMVSPLIQSEINLPELTANG